MTTFTAAIEHLQAAEFLLDQADNHTDPALVRQYVNDAKRSMNNAEGAIDDGLDGEISDLDYFAACVRLVMAGQAADDKPKPPTFDEFIGQCVSDCVESE